MAKATNAVFTLNGAGGGDVKLPDVHADTPLNPPLFPDASYFERPADMVPGQKLIARLNPEGPLFGQAFGYIAPKGQCILDLDGPDNCWMVPPSPTNYDYAHQGTTILNDGTVLATANIGGAGGHAPHEMGWAQVPRFYEDVSSQMARVRYGEDEFGVYAVGVVAPDMTWGGAVKMLASATSGDWRWVDELRAWDFMGACAVNLPGLPLHVKSGTRVARKASATPIGDTCMIVTMNGSIEPDTEVVNMGAHSECDCQKTAKTAAGETPTPLVGLTADEVDERITAALEARDAQWQAKIDEAVTGAIEPLNNRLSTIEEISLSVLDGV